MNVSAVHVSVSFNKALKRPSLIGDCSYIKSGALCFSPHIEIFVLTFLIKNSTCCVCVCRTNALCYSPETNTTL